MLLPLGVIVGVAIVCIVVAALTSARRADDVALARERQLLTRAIVNHGEWSLLRLRNVVQSHQLGQRRRYQSIAHRSPSRACAPGSAP